MGDYQQKVSSTFNERMKMIRLRRKKENLRFWDEFRIVPRWLVWIVVFLFLTAQAVGIFVNHWYLQHNLPVFNHDISEYPILQGLALAGVITVISAFLATFIFLIGYVNRDAKRRGMNSALWTLLVTILLPAWTFLGFLIYFLMREPMPYPCPQCAKPVGARFNFCPNCKCNLHPSCPNCKREVVETDKFCPYCGSDVKLPPTGEIASESV